MPRLAAGVRQGIDELGAQVQSAVPILQGQSALQLPAGGAIAPLGAAPVADNVPLFVRDPQLQVNGRVPSFAAQPGRTLQIVLNGTVISSTPVADNGAFSAALALKDGANAISFTLMAGRDLVATSTYAVTLDRTPPTLTLSRPQAGSTVDAQNVIVQGTTEAGATVTVNGHTVVVAQDGAFSDFITTTPGPLAIAVVSRDRAGNETTQKLDIIAEQIAQTPGTMLAVGLDHATVSRSSRRSCSGISLVRASASLSRSTSASCSSASRRRALTAPRASRSRRRRTRAKPAWSCSRETTSRGGQRSPSRVSLAGP